MKKKLFKIAIILVVAMIGNIMMAEYNVKENKVYYEDILVEGANTKTLKKLSKNYMTDGKRVFYFEREIKGADPDTFQVLEHAFSKDKNHVYYETEKIEENINTSVVKILNKFYFKDNKNVYLMYGKVEGADPDTFELLTDNMGYSKDKNNVYYTFSVVEGADVKTFEIIKEIFAYAKDKNNLYYDGIQIDKINTKDFSILSEDLIRNNNKIFFQGTPLKEIDGKKFRFLTKETRWSGLSYGTDEKNIYVIGLMGDSDILRTIKNVDISTFKVMEDGKYSFDKNNVYYTGYNGTIKIEGADISSFTPIKNSLLYSKDKNSLYISGKKVKGISPENLKIFFLPFDVYAFLLKNDTNIYYMTANESIVDSFNIITLNSSGMDLKTFEAVGEDNNYFKDKNNLYMKNFEKGLVKIEGFDIKSMVILDDFYIKDKNNVYCNGKIMKEADSKTFTITHNKYGNEVIKDKYKIYDYCAN